MTNAKAYDKLLNKINKQLSKHNILVHTGVIVDASITDSPRAPKGKRKWWLASRNILLFDDVITTGATIEACAKAIQHSDPKLRIWIGSIAFVNKKYKKTH